MQMELFTWFMAWDYFRVVALLPQALGGGNPGLIFESFRPFWFTQAAGLALDCFVDLPSFSYIAAFHTYLTNMRNIAGFLLCCWDLDLPCITTVSFAMITWFLQELQMVRLVHYPCLCILPLNIPCGCTSPSDTAAYSPSSCSFSDSPVPASGASNCLVTLHIFQFHEFTRLSDTSGIEKLYQPSCACVLQPSLVLYHSTKLDILISEELDLCSLPAGWM